MTDISRLLDVDQARNLLSDLGIVLNERQMRRAVEPDAQGRRKLPFFRDPITKRLVIAEDALKQVYASAQTQAVSDHGKNQGQRR